MGEEIEITRDLVLTERQRLLLDLHSVGNILNVVGLRIGEIGSLVGDDDATDRLRELVAQWYKRLQRRAETVEQLGRVEEMRARVLGAVRALQPRVPEPQRQLFEHHLDNLESVFDVLAERATELIERADGPNPWGTVSLEDLESTLRANIEAIEKNSLGRYHIAFSSEQRAQDDYLMQFDFRSRDGRSIRMPVVLTDVARDLACNARKYTDPGGWIRVTLVEEDNGLLLQVEDNGRGIPEDEIAEVVEFGYRASNVGDRVQTGGGFGMTRAYAVARTFGGRMWIRSGKGQGTRVTLRIPTPPRQRRQWDCATA